jgi:hypothetical protein
MTTTGKDYGVSHDPKRRLSWVPGAGFARPGMTAAALAAAPGPE